MDKVTALCKMAVNIIKGAILIMLIVFFAKSLIDGGKKNITKDTQSANTNVETTELSEADLKKNSVDYSYTEVTKDETTYKNSYIKGDFMVRQIGTYEPTGETIYLCGEKTDDRSYASGTFYVFDRRNDKTQPIKLYDKIYMYGQVKALQHVSTMNKNVIDPYINAKYIEFKGKFGEAK